MNCEEVKAHLLDYLDKTLDTPTMTRVATHLISCAPCGSEASELADCVRQVSALPTVDPPLGFAQRVMAHVREIEAKPSLWERLFSPWRKRIPLQATALVMVGIIGAVLYQKVAELKRSDPSEIVTRAASVPTDKIQQAAIESVTAPVEKKDKLAVKSPLKAAQQVQRARENLADTAPSIDRSAAAKSELDARLEENKVAKRPPIQVQEASNPSESGRFTGGAPPGFAPTLPPMPLGGARQAVPRSAPLALERSIPLGERVADFEFVVRRRAPQRRDQAEGPSADSLRKSTDEDNAAGLAARPAAPAVPATPKIESIAEIRFYNVAPEHYEFFRMELASEAIIESESKPAVKEKEGALADRQLLIKVTILPPAAPSSTPSR